MSNLHRHVVQPEKCCWNSSWYLDQSSPWLDNLAIWSVTLACIAACSSVIQFWSARHISLDCSLQSVFWQQFHRYLEILGYMLSPLIVKIKHLATMHHRKEERRCLGHEVKYKELLKRRWMNAITRLWRNPWKDAEELPWRAINQAIANFKKRESDICVKNNHR